MKGSSCGLVASVFAASTVAIASSSSAAGDASVTSCCCEGFNALRSAKAEERNSASVAGSAKDKFAPRFDGLRFIETLVTAHR